MADFTQTVSNTMQVLGVSPGSLWGTAVWGTDKWGVDEDVWTDTNHQIAESLTLADSIPGKDLGHLVTESLSLSSDISSLLREWGIWDYLFVKPSSGGQDQVIDQFTKVSDTTTTYSDVTTTSTTWTDV